MERRPSRSLRPFLAIEEPERQLQASVTHDQNTRRQLTTPDSLTLRDLSDRVRLLERRIADMDLRALVEARTLAEEARADASEARRLAHELTQKFAEVTDLAREMAGRLAKLESQSR